LIDKQDAYEGELNTSTKVEQSEPSSLGRDVLSVKLWTESKMNNCQTARDSLTSGPGTSLKQETDFRATGLLDDTPATNGHHDSISVRNDIQENGYGSPHDKQRSGMINRDMKHCQYEHNIHQESFEPPVAVDSLPKGHGGDIERDARLCETWGKEAPSPTGERECNKTGNAHSEVTKIVPLKPQRSKKSLNKGNTGAVNTQCRPDRGISGATGDVQMTKSNDVSCDAGRRADGDAVKENTAASKYYSEAAMSYQQQTLLRQQIKNELRDGRGPTGQSLWTRGGQEDHFLNYSEFKENFLSGSKFPTAPPRTLPLKMHWSRDRPSSVDSSHIHYRTPGQETAKWKQAVNPSAP